MNRYDYENDEYDDAEADWPEDGARDSEDGLDANFGTGEQDVEISMEIDEHGREVWFAQDSRIPGGGSMGHSVEEAMEGIEDRRREYREMLKRSREGREPAD